MHIPPSVIHGVQLLDLVVEGKTKRVDFFFRKRRGTFWYTESHSLYQSERERFDTQRVTHCIKVKGNILIHRESLIVSKWKHACTAKKKLRYGLCVVLLLVICQIRQWLLFVVYGTMVVSRQRQTIGVFILLLKRSGFPSYTLVLQT